MKRISCSLACFFFNIKILKNILVVKCIFYIFIYPTYSYPSLHILPIHILFHSYFITSYTYYMRDHNQDDCHKRDIAIILIIFIMYVTNVVKVILKRNYRKDFDEIILPTLNHIHSIYLSR